MLIAKHANRHVESQNKTTDILFLLHSCSLSSSHNSFSLLLPKSSHIEEQTPGFLSVHRILMYQITDMMTSKALPTCKTIIKLVPIL